MTAVAVPVFVSRSDEDTTSAPVPADRSPEVMHRLRFPFRPTAPADTADAGESAV